MLPKSNVVMASGGQLAVVADQTVAEFHSGALTEQLPTGTPFLTFPSGEASKSLVTAATIFDRLAQLRFERGGVIIAFGGGVAGDLAGFVACTWLRGVRWIQVPTTLLAAVDASVGGKTGVNLATGKNLVGVFHQPAAVIIDTDFLATLPDRDFVAGFAETVKQAAIRDPDFLKQAAIRDPDFLEWHETHADALGARDAEAVAALIARNCELKADIVARDEREASLRAILNYGHTIGHALEHLLEYDLRHGECVALGILVENEIACRRGVLSRAEADRVTALLARLKLPDRLPRPVSAEDVLCACRVDKKVRAGAVNFVLLRAIGRPWQTADVSADEVAGALTVIAPA